MTFVVEEDEAFDPVDIGFLSPWAVMPGADCLADLVEELWLWRDRWRRNIHGRLSTPTDHFKSVVNQTFYFGIIHGDLLARLESGERKEPDPLLRQSNPSDRESGSRPQSDLCSGRSFTPPKGQLPYSLLSYLSTNHLDEGEVIGFNRI